jgi:hypothetical protein
VPTYAILGEFDPVLNEKVIKIKSKVRELIGEQQYLANPPHCTFYLGLFDDCIRWPDDLIASFHNLPKESFRMDLISLGTFYKDTVTGNNTLFFGVDTETKNRLVLIQTLIVETVNDYRSKELTGRYIQCLDRFNADQINNLKHYGFPYVGNSWIPHISIASINPVQYEEAYPEISDRCPNGTGIITTISIYEIRDDDNLRHVRYLYRDPDYA